MCFVGVYYNVCVVLGCVDSLFFWGNVGLVLFRQLSSFECFHPKLESFMLHKNQAVGCWKLLAQYNVDVYHKVSRFQVVVLR